LDDYEDIQLRKTGWKKGGYDSYTAKGKYKSEKVFFKCFIPDDETNIERKALKVSSVV
jgi:hypothetical protein